MSGTPAVTLTHDPNGTFSSGATFNILDLAFSTLHGCWHDGIEFLIYNERDPPFRAIVVGGVPVADDGRHLRTWASGAYKWIRDAVVWTNTGVTGVEIWEHPGTKEKAEHYIPYCTKKDYWMQDGRKVRSLRKNGYMLVRMYLERGEGYERC